MSEPGGRSYTRPKLCHPDDYYHDYENDVTHPDDYYHDDENDVTDPDDYYHEDNRDAVNDDDDAKNYEEDDDY